MLKSLESVEKQIIGSMIIDPVCFEEGCKKLTDSCFNNDYHVIFNALYQLFQAGSPADIATVESQISKNGHHVKAEKLMDITIDHLSSNNFAHHCKILIERRARKALINESLRLNHLLTDEQRDVGDTLKEFSEKSSAISETKAGIDEYSHSMSVGKYLDYLEKGMKTGGELKGVKSHLPDLDKVINGYQHGLTYVIGGLKKTGKSRFALDMVSNFLSQGLCGVVFSMEMSENKIHDCIFANRLLINTAKFGTSGLSMEEFQKIMQECNNYSMQNLWISRKSRVEPEYIKDYIRHVNRKKKVDFVVVDYIQRMKGKGESRTKEIEYCMTSLADIGRDEHVIMISLSQLNKDAENKGGNSPIYSHYKESQAIIEAADTIITLDDPNRGKEMIGENYKELDAIILQRDGLSDVWVKLHAQLQYSKFNCVSGREE